MRKFAALLLAVALLLSGCGRGAPETDLDPLFTATETALSAGDFFFRGKVVSVLSTSRQISFYEADMGGNTFYGVEVTDDYFGCMPERIVTVCVLGSKEGFPNRTTLIKGREYLFDVSLWVQGEEPVFLLPTFYSALPEYRDGTLYWFDGEETVSPGRFEDYRARFDALAASYGPETVLTAVRERLALAAERNSGDFFTDLGFEQVDTDLLTQTAETAAALLARAEQTETSWEGIRELLQ